MGTLCAATRRPRDFTGDEIGLLNAIATPSASLLRTPASTRRSGRSPDSLGSRRRTQGLFENATEPIFVYDLQGKIIAANRACAKLSGFALRRWWAWYRYVSVRGSPECGGEIAAKLLDGQAVDGPFELRLIKRDGTEAIVEVMPSLIVRGEQPVGVQAIARDVTEARRMQESLRLLRLASPQRAGGRAAAHRARAP